MSPTVGTPFYLAPWWVEVASYSPKSKMVRLSRIGMPKAPLLRVGLKTFLRQARAV
ncbi:hypothetical protein [Arenimonas alkanexedens]